MIKTVQSVLFEKFSIKAIGLVLAVFLSGLALAGCATGAASPAAAQRFVTGSVVAPAAVKLPSGAIVTVQLVDLSAMESAPASQGYPPVIAQQVTGSRSGFPIPINLGYTDAQVNPQHIYGLQAVVTDASGNRLLATLEAYPVITAGSPSRDITLALAAPSAAQAAVTSTPPGLPDTGADDSWSLVQASAKLRVALLTNDPPFAYANAQGALDGFDVALVNALARQLNLAVELTGLPYNGLASAVTLKQVDLAIAAIPLTPDSQQVFTLSNVYLVDSDAVLARQDSPLSSLSGLSALAAYKVGVESGSVYEQRLKTALVDTGQMPAASLRSYPSAGQAVQALQSGSVDLVLLGLLQADAYVQSGGVRLVAQRFNQQGYAIAMLKGSAALQQRVNQALLQLQDAGTLSGLSSKYLGTAAASSLPVAPAASSPTPAAAPSATPSPTLAPPTAVPAACTDGMAFVQDLTYLDYNMSAPPLLAAGQAFTKGWRVQNTGACTWNSAYSLVYVAGNAPQAQMSGGPLAISALVSPGATADLYVNLIAPLSGGTYQGFWQLRNAAGGYFGDRIWVGVTVGSAPASAPQIYNFSLQPAEITAGQCVLLSWTATDNLDFLSITRQNVTIWTGNPSTGSIQDCPPGSGQVVYTLTANGPGGLADLSGVLQVDPLPAPSATPTATPTPTPAPTATPTLASQPPTPAPTFTPAPTPTLAPPTLTPSPTFPPAPTATPTRLPPPATPTLPPTPVPPTATPLPTATRKPIPTLASLPTPTAGPHPTAVTPPAPPTLWPPTPRPPQPTPTPLTPPTVHPRFFPSPTPAAPFKAPPTPALPPLATPYPARPALVTPSARFTRPGG